jgi:TRAP-type mannitol/chloroaromatic compound transport system substrate-binding protein
MEESFIAPSQQNEASPEIVKRGKIEKELMNVLESYANNEEKFSDIYKKISALSTELRRFLNQEKQTYTTFLQHL